MTGPAGNRRRIAELIVLFTVGPALLALGPRWLVTVGILASGVACALALARDPTFRRRELVGAAGLGRGMARLLPRTLLVWAGLLLVTAVARPDALIPLSALAGLLLTSTYARSRSTLLVAVEHALYGDFVFSVGLGALFYSGARWVGHAGG
jgi:hypothetical protein